MTPLDISALPLPAQKALAKDAPGPLRMMAAKGIVPGAKPAETVTVLVGLTLCGNSAIEKAAKATLDSLAPPLLAGALAGALQGVVIDAIATRYPNNAEVVVKLLRMPQMADETLAWLTKGADEAIGEIIASNETLLLAHPGAIEALYMNKRVRMSTADRILELAVRNGLELNIPAFKQAAEAIVGELIAEPTEEETFDDRLFKETEEAAARAELVDDADVDTHEVNEDGEEEVRQEFIPLNARISQMTISQKIRRAMLGNSAERMLLIRETNRLVASAAASSPQLNENDAARIAASRNVIDDVLRIIAQNRSFTRSYQVKRNLILNPKTPFTFTARMIPHLRDNDLRALVKSKSIPANVRTAARQQLLRKKK